MSAAGRTIPSSRAEYWQKACTANATDTAFPAKVPTTTTPSGSGVIDLRPSTGLQIVPAWLVLVPFGTGNDDATFDVRVIGWRPLVASGATTIWVPTTLLQFSATLSTAVGVAGAAVIDTERFADTVGDPPAGGGTKGVDCQPFSPANNTPGHYTVATKGCPLVEVVFDLTGATAANCLVART